MYQHLILGLLSLVLAIQAAPRPDQYLTTRNALQLCRDLGVDVDNLVLGQDQVISPVENKRLRQCFDILLSAEQNQLTEAALMMVLMKRLQTSRALGYPILDLVSKGLAASVAGNPEKTVAAGIKSLSRVKRQMMFPGGGEVGEDPGKRMRKMRLGLPLGEPGEDVGKRMRNRGMAGRRMYPRMYNYRPPYFW
ncbi:hypothetical protein SNE40_021446 [Patella caerulea]|uniref:Uncharacterized protein n=1 Tax=Patella caerulea TaxID=87958 RepID=A0AAN8FZJ2_PATCE